MTLSRNTRKRNAVEPSGRKNPVLPNFKSQALLWSLANLIRISYVLIALLLAVAVVFSIRFRDAARWRMSPAFSQLEERDRRIAEIRKYVTQGVTSTRDQLINNHLNSEDLYAQEMRRAKINADKSLVALSPWSPERAVLAQIDRDLWEFWNILDTHHFVTVQEKSERGYDFLHTELFPLRNAVFDNLKVLTDRNTEERVTLARGFAQERSRDLTYIFVVMGSVIAITLFMASGNQRHRRNFQIESRKKFEEVARARDSLEQLSGRLLRIQEDERRKISRELHDGIGQLLTALRMEIHQVQFAPPSSLTSGERLVRARKLAEEAVQTVNNISLLLRPPLLDDLGLEPALGWLANQFGRRTKIPCRFTATNLREQLPDDIRTCIFRVIQEALNNIEKHASPTRVAISVEQSQEGIIVCVEDDGVGFVLDEMNAPARHAGLGILGMRERAVLLGGNLTIRSAPGNGTKITIKLPVATVGTTASPAEIPASGQVVVT